MSFAPISRSAILFTLLCTVGLPACSKTDSPIPAGDQELKMRDANAHVVLQLQVRLNANVDAEAVAQSIETESNAKGARISLHKDDPSTQQLELELVGPQISEAELRAHVLSLVPDLDPSTIQITRLDDVQVQDLDPDLHEASHLEDPTSAKAAVESLLKARGEQATVEISDVDGHRQIKIESHKQE